MELALTHHHLVKVILLVLLPPEAEEDQSGQKSQTANTSYDTADDGASVFDERETNMVNTDPIEDRKQ